MAHSSLCGGILTSVAGQGSPNLASQSCAANFSSTASYSRIGDAAYYPGEGEHFPLSLGNAEAHLSPGLEMGQVCQPPSSSLRFGLHLS